MVYNFLRLSFLLVSTALAVILPSTDSNFTTDVLHHKRRDLDGLDQSMTVLSLEADIEGINSTHVRIIIVNTYSSDIAILVWNSVFDQGMADYSSFQVVPTGMQNAMPLSPGYGTVVKQYRRPTARSFLNIRARDRFTKDIDLTTRFLVPKADSYQVSFQDTFRAVLLADASATQLLSSAALRGFPTLLIGSHRPLIFLDPPPSIASLKRQASSPGTCQSPYRDVVRTARIRAQQLARSAREATDSSTWIEYFNGVQEVQNMVHQVFDGVMYFLHPKTYGISIRCETHVNRQQTCEQDVLAYHERQESGFALIVFCLYFFQIPAIDECSIPSERPYMVDQAGTYLHELTHNTMLTGGIEIKDG
ncbi:MAG: hypothetical protein M1836_006802 [Candelina mexicana]|nr:MAG: hypothetical protein M1836_006802 [Candelina mexicana]